MENRIDKFLRAKCWYSAKFENESDISETRSLKESQKLEKMGNRALLSLSFYENEEKNNRQRKKKSLLRSFRMSEKIYGTRGGFIMCNPWARFFLKHSYEWQLIKKLKFYISILPNFPSIVSRAPSDHSTSPPSKTDLVGN